ncbi:hypothetical protein BGZ93_002793 [Podila epicladia]|nr:hypothetical protein BGZ92_007554 [Podila epicladia]KAG0097405.1 hypothetical protein BGZ93_002793 [Podila epicladia]
MARPTSVFEIPLLMDLICENLFKDEIAACRLVCRAWSQYFEPLLWQDWELSDDHELDPEHRQILADYAGYARDLIVCMSEKGTMGPFLQGLTLRSIACVGLHSLSSLDCSSVQGPKTSQDNSAIARTVYYLIQQNPGLRNLSIADISFHKLTNLDPGVKDGGLFSVLADHTYLRTLVLSSSRSVSDGQARALLQHIPVSLQVLEVNWEVTSHDKKKRFPDIGWKANSSLRRLRLRGSFKNYENSVLVPFLGRCPGLIEIALPSMNSDTPTSVANLLAETCPSLQELDLRAGQYTEDEILVFLDRLGPLRAFMLGEGNHFERFVLELVAKSHRTLEVLKFERNVCISGQDMERILNSCSRLRVFEALTFPARGGLWRGGEDCSGLLIDQLLAVNTILTSLLHGLHLRELAISWMPCPLFDYGPATGPDGGWCEQTYDYDLSCRNGLEYLESLTELRILDLDGLRSVRFGEEECFWVAQHWPKLKEIHGLINHIRNETEFTEKLQEIRPTVLLT